MANLEKYYYKPSVTLLSIIGLWPGESTILRRIQKASISFLVIAGLIIQLTPFITMEYSIALLLHNVPFIIIAVGSVLKYFTFLLQSHNVKEITKLIKHDWSTTKDDEESKIFIQHANVGKSYTIACAQFIYASATILLLAQYVSWWLLDIAAPLNETRSPQFYATFEVFVDQQKHVHILALMVDVLFFTTGTVYLATESMYMMWLLEQTSQFDIYAYRLRKAFLEESVKEHIVDRNARATKIFGSALDMYNRAILLDSYLRKFYPSYTIMLVLGVTSLSVELYRLSEALETDNFTDLIMCPLVIISEFGYMYFFFSAMQQVLDSYDKFLTTTYDTNWYAAPVCAQKMLLFAMLRNKQTFKNKLYGISDLSKEGFLTNVKVTFSYFMMLRSIR